MFNLANLTVLNSIVRMKVTLPYTFSLVALLFLTACQNKYRQTEVPSSGPPVDAVNVSGDAYQVTAQEYDQLFETRYGLLFQKFSDSPFTGRVVTAEKSADGVEYVSSDESWSKGRKHGVSTRWFSNGVKMYERNYNDGKWHGTVTRWWPNGQKMYVRAYSDGLKRGKEATWRSDGTPIDLASGSAEEASSDEPETPREVTPPLDSFPSSDAPSDEPPSVPGTEDSPAFPAAEPSPVDLPSFPVEDEPGLPPVPAPSGGDDLPGLPPLDSGSGDLPPLPGGDDFPDLPPLDSGSGDLPPLPGAESEEEDLPPLPSFPE